MSAFRIRLTLTLLGLTIVGCGAGVEGDEGSANNTWVGASTVGAMLLSWTEISGGELSGSVQLSRLDGETVQGETMAFQGVTANGSLTLRISGLLGQVTPVSGDVASQELTLHWPIGGGQIQSLSLRPGTVDDYNLAVDGLRDTASALRKASEDAAVAGNAIAMADRSLSESGAALENAVDGVQNAQEWVGYGLDDLEAWLDTLRNDVSNLIETVASEPEYAEFDFGLVEFSFSAVVGQAEYLLGEGVLGDVESQLSFVVAAIRDLEVSIEGVREAEDRYLGAEFAPTDLSGQRTAAAEARELVTVAGPSFVATTLATVDQAEAEAQQLMLEARALVP